jgi:hypothetical protein
MVASAVKAYTSYVVQPEMAGNMFILSAFMNNIGVAAMFLPITMKCVSPPLDKAGER